jgi:hypothetical protein
MENIIDRILRQKYTKEEIEESNKLYAKSQYCNSINLENVKPILIVKVNYTTTIEDRLGFKKAVIEETCNQYHVIVIGEDVKETTFEIVK